MTVGDATWTPCFSASELSRGEMLGLEINGKSVAVYQLSDGLYYATDNICTHAYALLTEGWLTDEIVECPLHGGCFDVRTGKGTCEPITEALKTYPVKIVDGTLCIDLG